MAMLDTRAAGDRAEARLTTALLGIALVAAIAAYARVMSGEFQFDDQPHIERNLAVKDLSRFHSAARWTHGTRPLTDLTLAVNYATSRLDPFAYHATNLAIHLTTALLLYLVGRRALRAAAVPAPDACAAAAASLFTLHPLHTESVSYVIQRAESLSSALFVAALLLLLETERSAPLARRVLSYAAALVTAVAALAAKPVAATLPAAYLLYSQAFAPPGERTGRPLLRRLLLSAPLFLLVAAAAWRAIPATSGATDAGFHIPELPAGSYVLTQARVVFRYLALLAVPIGQNVDHYVSLSRSLAEPATTAMAVLALLAIAAMAVVILWRHSATSVRGVPDVALLSAFGALWFLVLLSPSSLVPLVDVMAEHRVYLASWGVLLAVVAGAQAVAHAWKVAPVARVAALATVLALLAAATWSRNAVWETRAALWSDAVEKSPAKPRPFGNLGLALARQGEHARAVTLLRRALALEPDERIRGGLLRTLGASLAHMGRHAEAEAVLTEAAGYPGVAADARCLLAISLAERGLLEAAREQATLAIGLDPGHPAARNALGDVFLRQGNPAAALEQLQLAVRFNPDSAPPRYFVAVALQRLGRIPEACAALGEYLALETAPADVARAESFRRRLGCGVH